MKTISIIIDEPLLGHLDRAARRVQKTRSELFRLALQEWLDGQRRRQLVATDRAGYEAHPVHPDEFEGRIAAEPPKNHGLVDALLACPENDWFEPIMDPSE